MNFFRRTAVLICVVQNPGFNDPAYPADDYSFPKGSPGVGFVVFEPKRGQVITSPTKNSPQTTHRSPTNRNSAPHPSESIPMGPQTN